MILTALTNDELKFVKCIEAGELCDFGHTEGCRPTVEPAGTIGAQLIVDIVRGKPVQGDGESEGVVGILSAGIRLRGATITGELCLDNTTWHGGSAFPAIALEYCWFKQDIHLERSRLQSLSLKYSRFQRVWAPDARIEGTVDLRGVSGIDPLDPNNELECFGECRIYMASTRVTGRVLADHARFCAPPKRTNFNPQNEYALYALDLRAADIQGSVFLRPNCVAVGGISLSLAKIDGSVWATGARLSRIEESAFAADYAIVRGSIYFRPGEPPPDKGHYSQPQPSVSSAPDASLPPDPVELPPATMRTRYNDPPTYALGPMSLFACKLGGSLYLEGTKILAPILTPEEQAKASLNAAVPAVPKLLDLRSAEISANCNLNYWISEFKSGEAFPFEAQGQIDLDSAHIGNRLSLTGATCRSVTARGAKIGGDFELSVYALRDKIYRFTNSESLWITGATINGDLNFSGARIGPGKTQEGTPPAVLGLTGTTVGGNCYLCAFPPNLHQTSAPFSPAQRFHCFGNIRFDEARINNSLVMDGACIEAPRDNDQPALDLSGTHIGGEASFKTWYLPQLSAHGIPFTAKGGRIVLKLFGTRIGQRLKLNGACLEALPLPCPPQTSAVPSALYALNAINASIQGEASLSTFVPASDTATEHYRFSAVGQVCFAAAAIHQGLTLSGARLRCVAEWCGPSDSQAADLPAAFDPEQNEHRYALDLNRARLKFLRCGLDRALPRNRFDAVGTIRLTQTQIDDEVVFDCARLDGYFNASGTRIGRSASFKEMTISANSFDSEVSRRLDKPDEPEKDKEILKALQRLHSKRAFTADVSLENGHIENKLTVHGINLKPQPPNGTSARVLELRHATIDLRGLHVGELDDEGGLGWGLCEEVRLWLDGFRYARLPEIMATGRSDPLKLIIHKRWLRLFNPSALVPKVNGPSDLAGARKKAAPEIFAKRSNPSGTVCPPVALPEPPDPAGRSDPDLKRNPPILHWLQSLMSFGGGWQQRLRWLSLQYFYPERPRKSEYNADAYEQLVRAYRDEGLFKDARRITSARITAEARLCNIVSLFFYLVFRVLFDYGLSIYRALTVFVLCIFIGALGVKIANDGTAGFPGLHRLWPCGGQVLVANTGAPETRLYKDPNGITTPYPLKDDQREKFFTERMPCHKHINLPLYALDVFVPGLNLHQQDACAVESGQSGWRYAKAIYAMLGWILTPLTVLTVTGILRRHLEK